MRNNQTPVPPDISREAERQVKRMAREYHFAKLRVRAYPNRRPTLIKQLQVTMDEYDTTGSIQYDEELAKKMHPKDQAFISQYVEDMYLIFVLEKGIATIQDETTRHIAEDTLLNGKRCKDLEKKYGIRERAIRQKKREAIRLLSLMI